MVSTNQQRQLATGLLFWLYTQSRPPVSLAEYLHEYPELLVSGTGEFRTGSYTWDFPTDQGQPPPGVGSASASKIQFGDDYQVGLQQQLRRHT